MSDLIEQLRRLARYNHDDLSIGTDAADRIEQLERELAAAKERIWQLADAAFTQNAAREKAEASCAALVEALIILRNGHEGDPAGFADRVLTEHNERSCKEPT